MNLSEIFRTVRSRWTVVALVGLLGVAAAAALTFTQTPKYVSSAKVYISIASASSTTDLQQGAVYAQQVVKSYADIATTPFVLDSVRSELNLSTPVAALAEEILVSAPPDETVLEIEVTDSSPRRAADIANSVARRLSSAVSELSPTSSGERTPIRITQVQTANVSLSPSYPRPVLNLAVGLLLGLAAGLVASIVRENLDTRIRSANDIERITSAPVIGATFFEPAMRTEHLITMSDPQGRQSEAFRSIRTGLKYVARGHDGKVLVFTSSLESEGKSTTVANIAISLAESGSRVLVVDADLRRPRVAEYFGMDSGVGLTETLVGDLELADAIQHWGEKELYILPAGSVPPNPSELLDSTDMASLLARVREMYDIVLVDAPPLLPVTDAAVVARHSNGVVLVAGVGKVRRGQMAAAAQMLDRVEVRVLAVVLTFAPARTSGRYGYGYGYGYGHG